MKGTGGGPQSHVGDAQPLGSVLADLLDAEPGLKWLAAQLVYVAQPVLESLIPEGMVERWVRFLEQDAPDRDVS